MGTWAQTSLPETEKQALNITAVGFAETDRVWFASVALLFLINYPVLVLSQVFAH